MDVCEFVVVLCVAVRELCAFLHLSVHVLVRLCVSEWRVTHCSSVWLWLCAWLCVCVCVCVCVCPRSMCGAAIAVGFVLGVIVVSELGFIRALRVKEREDHGTTPRLNKMIKTTIQPQQSGSSTVEAPRGCLCDSV